MDKPRAYTPEEVRDTLLNSIRETAKYWAEQPNKTPLEIANGVAFSILATLDGCQVGCPGFSLKVAVHEDDKQYHKDRGENWYKNGQSLGCFFLHDHFHQ